jgi:hypothetical protein
MIDSAMRYEVELPNDVAEELIALASASGEDVERLLRAAVVAFVRRDDGSPAKGRRPDPLLEPVEISAPFDLPRGIGQSPQYVEPIPGSPRRPDPITQTE